MKCPFCGAAEAARVSAAMRNADDPRRAFGPGELPNEEAEAVEAHEFCHMAKLRTMTSLVLAPYAASWGSTRHTISSAVFARRKHTRPPCAMCEHQPCCL